MRVPTRWRIVLATLVIPAGIVVAGGGVAHAATVPSNTAAPVLSGNPVVGSTLSVTTGTWSGTTPITYSYQWQSCTKAGASCVNFADTTSTYVPAASMVGRTVKCRVMAKNSAGSKTAFSNLSGVIVSTAAPTNSAQPTVSGTPADGGTLTATTGTWSGSGTITYVYQWLSCANATSTCNPINNATGSHYQIASTDVGSGLAVRVTASNTSGSGTSQSSPTSVVQAAAPTKVTAPSISGTDSSGSTLTADPGQWKGTPTISFGYQWQRCDTGGNNCTPIGVATAQYTATPADIGATLDVVVTATNTAGSPTATSAATPVITGGQHPPVNTTLPQVTGTAAEGQAVSSDNGSWTSATTPTYSYQWQRCTSTDTSTCAAIPGATQAGYTATSDDVTDFLRSGVTAANGDGPTTAFSSLTGAVAGTPPTNSAPPALTGRAVDGATLSVSPGTWTGTPTITFTYQWQQCDGTVCSNLPNATLATYGVQSTDVSHQLQVVVTAANKVGTKALTAGPVGPVAAAPPAPTSPVTISGSATVGSDLTATFTTWTGTPTITFAYEWQRCDSAGANCTDEATADPTKGTYHVVPQDAGSTIVVKVTGSNAAGPASSTSQPTGIVQVPAPQNTAKPTVGGQSQVGQTLTADPGTWVALSPSYAYQWEQCDATGNACQPVTNGGQSQSYLVRTYDKGRTLVVQVTATDGTSSGTTANSDPTSAVAAATSAVTVALWHMEDSGSTMADASGYGNSGTLQNVLTGKSGSTGLAYKFSGSPSRVVVPSDQSLDPTSDAFTVTLHVKLGTAPSSTVGDYDLIRKGLSADGPDWKVEVMSTGRANCYAQGGSGNIAVTGGPNLATSTWHTVSCVVKPTSIKLIVDGTTISTRTGTLGSGGNTATLSLGAKVTDGDQYSGLMDEVRVAVG